MKNPRDMTNAEIVLALSSLRHDGGLLHPECGGSLRLIADRMRELIDEQDRRTEAQFAAAQEHSREHTPDYE